jgi:hypothetical protein
LKWALACEARACSPTQLGHSSVVLTADTYLSVAVEFGLKAAAAAARLVLNAGKSPPGSGSPAPQPGLQHVPKGETTVRSADSWSPTGPTTVLPVSIYRRTGP